MGPWPAWPADYADQLAEGLYVDAGRDRCGRGQRRHPLADLTYWISAKAGSAQGWELGKQTAAASLGVTLGSAAGGLHFNVAALPGASFVLAAGFTALGFLLSLGLPRLLAFRKFMPAPGISIIARVNGHRFRKLTTM